MLRPQTVDRYAIHERIASGGMASVHFGRSAGAAGFARTVAIKRLHPHLIEQPEFSATLVDEARLAARIHHPNVVPVLDVVSSGGELLVVMEYVRGESLAQLLGIEHERGGRVPLPIASAIVIGALHGLHAAHGATSERGAPLGIVHRDVSPANVLVGVDGVARVIDFGVAKATDRLQITNDGSIKGKRAYMAPEQAIGGDVTPLTDVYAMAVVLWETLTCKRLFEGDSNLLRAVRRSAATPPSLHAPEVTPALDAIVMKALSLDAASRFPSALAMAEALERAVPPASLTDVGAWVRTTARASLAKRDATLAAIEGNDDAPELAESAADEDPTIASEPGAELDHDDPTVPSQPSTLSVERPRSLPPLTPRARSVRPTLGGVAAVGGAALLVAAIAVGFGARHPPVPSPSIVAAPVDAVPSQPVTVAAPEVAPPEARGASTDDLARPLPVRAPRSRSAPPSATPHHGSPRRQQPGTATTSSAAFDPASIR